MKDVDLSVMVSARQENQRQLQEQVLHLLTDQYTLESNRRGKEVGSSSAMVIYRAVGEALAQLTSGRVPAWLENLKNPLL